MARYVGASSLLPSSIPERTFSHGCFFLLLIISFLCINSAAADAADVALSWDPNTEASLAGYKVYCGTASKNYPTVKDAGTQTTCIVTGLTAGTTYYFAAKAYASTGTESAYSSEVVYTIPATTPVDTDGDGLSDTDETTTYHTDPTKADTDGDGISDGTEVKNGTNPLVKDAPPAQSMLFEVGRATIDHTWQRVAFTQAYLDPVVVATPLSLNNSAPAVVRINNVNGSGFDIRVQEWEYLDGTHAAETVDYMVMERGRYTLANGSIVEAGRFTTSGTGVAARIRVSFQQAFQKAPVVVSSVVSCAEQTAVTGRVGTITTSRFEYCLQEQERNRQQHAAEGVAYIAWEPSAGVVNGITFEVNRTGTVITQAPYAIRYLTRFTQVPRFIGDMQTVTSGDTATVRCSNKTATGVRVRIAEETSLDTETSHPREAVGYMIFLPPATN